MAINEALKRDLDKLIDDSFNQNLGKKDVKDISEDEFYHAIYEIIQKLNDNKGVMLLKLPNRDDLRKKYTNQLSEGKLLRKEDFDKIVKEIITLDSFTGGKGALEMIAYVFGVPISAFFAKKFIPGGEYASDDILIPAVTSLTVLVLTKLNRL